MSITVTTSKPNTLLSSIKKAIDENTIKTWAYDSDGDFSQTSEQWAHKAWLRPRVEEGRLVFRILAPRETHLSSATYAVYHGRFIQMLLSHFDSKFVSVSASALPSNGDKVSPNS